MEDLKNLKNVPKEWKKCKNSQDRKKLAKKLWKEYQHLFWYVFFGLFTTVVNIVAYAICMHILQIGNVASNIVAWILAVTFAYLTNRKWVFDSVHHTKRAVAKEVVDFFIARGATGLLDLGIMFVTVDLLGWPDIILKIISNIIVIILNYVASKLWIFGSKAEREAEKRKKH